MSVEPSGPVGGAGWGASAPASVSSASFASGRGVDGECWAALRDFELKAARLTRGWGEGGAEATAFVSTALLASGVDVGGRRWAALCDCESKVVRLAQVWGARGGVAADAAAIVVLEGRAALTAPGGHGEAAPLVWRTLPAPVHALSPVLGVGEA